MTETPQHVLDDAMALFHRLGKDLMDKPEAERSRGNWAETTALIHAIAEQAYRAGCRHERAIPRQPEDTPGLCFATTPDLLDPNILIWCILIKGHVGGHRANNGADWAELCGAQYANRVGSDPSSSGPCIYTKGHRGIHEDAMGVRWNQNLRCPSKYTTLQGKTHDCYLPPDHVGQHVSPTLSWTNVERESI